MEGLVTLLDESTRNEVQKILADMDQPVRLMMFTQGHGGVPECRTCSEDRELAEEVASLNGKIHLEVRDIVADAALAEKMRVDKIPALAVLCDGPSPRDFGIRLYGVPGGFEFSTLIEDLLLVSRQKHDLSENTLTQIAAIREPVHIQVFTTPT
jgi:alkyl hydroperoxide reductase subunit AhpF